MAAATTTTKRIVERDKRRKATEVRIASGNKNNNNIGVFSTALRTKRYNNSIETLNILRIYAVWTRCRISSTSSSSTRRITNPSKRSILAPRCASSPRRPIVTRCRLTRCCLTACLTRFLMDPRLCLRVPGETEAI